MAHKKAGSFSCSEGEPVSRLPLVLEPACGSTGFDWIPADLLIGLRRLLGRSLRHRKNGYIGAAFAFRTKLNATIDE